MTSFKVIGKVSPLWRYFTAILANNSV